MNTILGKKIQQTQGFLENGTRIPVTVIAAADNPIIGVKTLEKDGYMALQVGFGLNKKPTKALLGKAKKANLPQVPHTIREIKLSSESSFQPGESIKVEEVLKPGDIISVTGTSKGKGFAGGVKRYHFKGGPRTHGQSDRERAPGSIGQTTTPGRVYKGKRMAGNMGGEQVTVHNLIVVDVDPMKKTVLVKGLVPGILGAVVTLTKTGEVKEKNFVPLFKLAVSDTNDAAAASQSEDNEKAVTEEAATVQEQAQDEIQTEQPKEEVSAEGQVLEEKKEEEKNA